MGSSDHVYESNDLRIFVSSVTTFTVGEQQGLNLAP